MISEFRQMTSSTVVIMTSAGSWNAVTRSQINKQSAVILDKNNNIKGDEVSHVWKKLVLTIIAQVQKARPGKPSFLKKKVPSVKSQSNERLTRKCLNHLPKM